MAALSVTSFRSTGRFRHAQVLGALGAFVLAGAGVAPAATFTVLNTSDSDPGSLRQAILDANGNSGPDTINFAPAAAGTILLSTALPPVLEDLDIAGPGSEVLTVSGNHAVSVFGVGFGVTATISDMTISDGSNPTTGGGSAVFNNGTLKIRGCTLAGNSASTNEGGAILNSGTLAINNSTLSGNSAVIGGAIFNQGTLTIEDSTLTGDHASFEGGGIENAGILTINNSTLSGNSADVGGGGILNAAGFNSPGGRLTINDSTLSGNSAGALGGGGGGGIGNGGVATINRSTLVGNTAIAGGNGGGIENIGTLTINNSTLSGNSAAGSGGGILNRMIAVFGGGTATISYSTLANNTAVSGGGLFNELSVSTVVIKSSLVANNGGGDCANPGGGSFTPLGVNQATDGSCPGFTQVAPALLRLGPLACC